MSYVLEYVKEKIIEKANVNIDEIDTNKVVKNVKVPVIFVTSRQDTVVRSHHVEKLYEQYPGHKKLIYLTGEHNEQRTVDF